MRFFVLRRGRGGVVISPIVTIQKSGRPRPIEFPRQHDLGQSKRHVVLQLIVRLYLQPFQRDSTAHYFKLSS